MGIFRRNRYTGYPLFLALTTIAEKTGWRSNEVPDAEERITRYREKFGEIETRCAKLRVRFEEVMNLYARGKREILQSENDTKRLKQYRAFIYAKGREFEAEKKAIIKMLRKL